MTFDRSLLDSRVAKGAKLLDEKRPGWAHKIDVDTFDIMDDCGCVLGQLEGDFEDALMRLLPDWRDDNEHVAHGFDAGQPFDPDEYILLTLAWKRCIAERVTQTA